MKRALAVLMTGTLALPLTALPNLAGSSPIAMPALSAPDGAVVEVKSNGNGKAKGHAKKKIKARGNGNAAVKVPPGQAKKAAGNADVKVIDRRDADVRVIEKRDTDTVVLRRDGDRLARIATFGIPLATLGTVGLSEVLVDCPPGLAKKAVPCVPPGQVDKQNVAAEWLDEDEETIRLALIDRWTEYDGWVERNPDIDGVPDGVSILSQQRIIDVFDLDPAPAGQRYAVIDGRPLLLDEDDWRQLRQLQTLDEVEVYEVSEIDLRDQRSHVGLLDLYDLPEPRPDHYYTAMDGDIYEVPSRIYEMLQLLRIAALAPGLNLG
ncbi:hypothetical protein [Mesobacterium pallidum]|uniref:hypothetical protein n=1 Tax=Mesobacterium pallidum TaxID=2872037 RepID=UPI001EE27E64|nr:hypothetical protein [Mesobacterium pallidum]